MKKISAFTIIELIVAMVLGGIIIGFCFSSYSAINSRFKNFFTRSHDLSEYRVFENVISKDIQKSYAVVGIDNQLKIYFSSADIVTYDMEDGCVSRKIGETEDVFKVSSRIADVSYSADNSSVADQLVIICKINATHVKLTLKKDYTPVELLKAKSLLSE